MSCPAGNLNNMGRSHSVSSTRSNRFDDDYRELLRAASTRSTTLGRSNNMDVRTRQQYITHQKPATEVTGNMSRSRSAAIGRIDEETACNTDCLPFGTTEIPLLLSLPVFLLVKLVNSRLLYLFGSRQAVLAKFGFLLFEPEAIY
ncbi:hypothetical protein OIU74_017388 [Salix koriyanagi]|uniref:Uncharacterized protein n=1 Tax=Salix koriyanagi TaxID=2511006 RepID=A0A9Q1AGU4_9ROSI|nr:hypothetical protein OIU74_017388 [Salix koriyanagi]